MAVFENFDVDANATYVLRNKQAAFATSTLRKPDDGQFLAVTWDTKKGEFKPVYFTAFDKKGDTIVPSEHVGERPVGEFQGSDLFIIYHPTHGVRADLRETITAWVEAKHVWDKTSNAAQKRRARSITIGQLVINGVEKAIGKSPITPKASTPAAAPKPTEADNTPVVQPAPRQEQQPVATPRPAERDPRSLPPIPSYISPDEPIQEAPRQEAGEEAEQIYRGIIKRDFDKGFTFISPDRNIPELDGKDAFLHISALEAGVELRAGQAVEFKIYYNAQRGNYQAADAWPVGSRNAIPSRTARQDNVRDADYQGEAPEEVQYDERNRAIIHEIPIRTPFGIDVIPGGAWRIKREPN